MPKTIQQTATFSASPARLYALYTRAREHAAAIGAAVTLERRPGGRFAAFDGMLRGRILALVPGRLVVQTWRGADWRTRDPDSLLVLAFEPAPRGGRVQLLHSGVPDRHAAGCRRGWSTYYWKPWAKHLRRKPR